MLFDVTSKQPKTKRGANRQYDALIRRYHDMFAGGGTFGWDWPTFHLNWPEGYARAKELIALSKTLPD